MDRFDAARRCAHKFVSDLTGSIRRIVIDDQDAHARQLEQALDDRPHVLRFVVGRKYHDGVKSRIHARPHVWSSRHPPARTCWWLLRLRPQGNSEPKMELQPQCPKTRGSEPSASSALGAARRASCALWHETPGATR